MYFKITVYPGAKKEKIVKKSADSWDVWVKEPAQRNLANERIKEILGAEISPKPKEIRLISGHHSNKKIFALSDNLTIN